MIIWRYCDHVVSVWDPGSRCLWLRYWCYHVVSSVSRYSTRKPSVCVKRSKIHQIRSRFSSVPSMHNVTKSKAKSGRHGATSLVQFLGLDTEICVFNKHKHESQNSVTNLFYSVYNFNAQFICSLQNKQLILVITLLGGFT